MFYTNVCKKGDYIYHVGYDNIGKKFCTQESFRPYIYYKGNDGNDISLYGDKLKKKVFENVNEFGKFVHNNRKLIDLYGDVSPCAQFITEAYSGKVNYIRNYIRIWWLDIEVNTDGEFPLPEVAKYPIVAMTIFDTRYNKYIVLGLNDYEYDSNRIKFNADVVYKKCEDEEDLLRKFIQLIQKFKPDIWIAHNGENFDYPYIINRVKKLNINPDTLSLFGKAKTSFREITENHITKKKYSNKIDGISLMDNMIMYKKYISAPRESYSLSNLAIEDLGLDKLNYDEYDNLEGLYEKNYTKYIDYNINDVYLMVLLNEKNGYVDLHIRNTYVTKCENFEIAMSPVAIWDTYIYHELAERNIQIPPGKNSEETFNYIGAFVVPTINKLHKWVVSLDVNSLYPHIQMEWNISPEKLVPDLTVSQWLQSLTEKQIDEYIEKSDRPEQIEFLNDLKEMNRQGLKVPEIRQDDLDDRMLNMLIPTHPDYIMSANGFYYKKDSFGIIPELLHTNYAERKKLKSVNIKEVKEKLKLDPSNKKLQEELASLDVAQLGIKIMMNSEYGALANNFFRYCKYEMCSSTTMNGQMIDRFLIKQFNEKYPEISIIAGDTDSCVGNTEIYYDNEKIKIEDLYNKVIKENQGKFIINDDFNKDYVYKLNKDHYTKSYSNETGLHNDRINYIMKHTVKKKMYKIKVNNKEVIVTQDHSLIVMRDNKLISVKPYQIKKTDKFIYIKNESIEMTNDFEIECLGEYEETVYDIEAETNHNFFANDILVHNSVYLSLENLVAQRCSGMSEDEIITWIDNFSTNEIQQVIDDTFIKIQKFFGAKENFMKMAREKVIIRALWTGKKHYGYKMIIEDDNRLSTPKYGYKGLECIKSSTPKKIRDLLKYTVNSILDDKDIYTVMQECKEKIMKLTPEEIAFPRTCNGLTKFSYDGKEFTKGTPAHVKAGLVYNKYLKDNKIKDYPKIEEGNKLRYVYLKNPNPFGVETFAFINRMPKDNNIINFIDYDIMYEKAYEKVITDMLEKIGLNDTISNSINLDDLF